MAGLSAGGTSTPVIQSLRRSGERRGTGDFDGLASVPVRQL